MPGNTFSHSIIEFFILQRFACSISLLRLSQALDNSIIVTPSFYPLFSLILQNSIIRNRES